MGQELTKEAVVQLLENFWKMIDPDSGIAKLVFEEQGSSDYIIVRYESGIYQKVNVTADSNRAIVFDFALFMSHRCNHTFFED